MFCRRCYTELDAAAESGRCPRCRRPFDPANPGTYLDRPFPDARMIVGRVIATTILGFIAAWMVAFHQMVQNSGH